MRNEKIEQEIRQIIAKLKPKQRERLLPHIKARSTAFREEIKVRKKFYPLKDLVPNIAQERALECYRKPAEGIYPYPIYNVFTGGNGVGKTVDLAIMLNGCACGNEFLNNTYHNHEFFNVMKKRRKDRSLIIWIVCKASDMLPTGSVYDTIKTLIPTANITGKTGDGHYTQIEIPSPESGYKPTLCTLKTFNMDVVNFSGTNCDLILFNEPLPDEKKFDECVGRIRGGGYISMFLTPLEAVAYVQKLVKDINLKGMVCHTQGSIWENCKETPGARGVLEKPAIEAQIAKWKRNPVTLRARVYGDFVHLAGAVFPIFNNDIHVIPTNKIPQKIDSGQMLCMAIDHHPKKPAVAVWMTLDALGIWRVIAEYPNDPWDEIIINDKSIRHFGYDFKLIESGMWQKFPYMASCPEVTYRFGDPNAFRCEQAHNRQTIQQQYMDDCDLDVDINIDNSIELRHDKIRDLLFYDLLRPISGTNSSKLYIYETCQNVICAFNYYLLKENNKPEEEWKDWIDVIGYIVTTITQFEPKAIYDGSSKIDREYKDLYSIPTDDIQKYDMYSTFGLKT